jgi:hypothetical protein
VDLLTTLTSYKSNYGSVIAVSHLTCMPFYSLHPPSSSSTSSSSSSPLDAAWAAAARAGGGSGGAAVFMVNATAHPPPSGSLKAPSYCKQAHRSSGATRGRAAPKAARGA